MAIILLDTDVFSFLFKDDSRAAFYAPLMQGQRLALSFMIVAELFQWARVRKWELRRTTQLGHPISPQDAWIAATALRHNLPLVTHNASDFESITNLDVRTATTP